MYAKQLMAIMLAIMFIVSPVMAADSIKLDKPVDLSKETYKAITADAKYMGLISVKDKSSEMWY